MDNLFRTIAFLGAVIGALILLATLGTAESAPQEAAGAAIAIGFAAIPYCMSRLLHDAYKANKQPNVTSS